MQADIQRKYIYVFEWSLSVILDGNKKKLFQEIALFLHMTYTSSLTSCNLTQSSEFQTISLGKSVACSVQQPDQAETVYGYEA